VAGLQDESVFYSVANEAVVGLRVPLLQNALAVSANPSSKSNNSAVRYLENKEQARYSDHRIGNSAQRERLAFLAFDRLHRGTNPVSTQL
jgi:hypothetical protein